LQWRSACHSTMDATVDRIGLGACTVAAACCDSSCIGPVTGAGSSHQQLRQARQLQCNASWHALAHAVTARSQLRSVQFSCAFTCALGVAYSVAAPVHLTTFSSSSDRDAPRRHGIRRHGTDHSWYGMCSSTSRLRLCGSVCLALRYADRSSFGLDILHHGALHMQ
jgi:hypothetical protein